MAADDTEETLAHHRAMLDAHTKLLRVLELRDAKLGEDTPPYIKIQIEDIKEEIATRQQALTDAQAVSGQTTEDILLIQIICEYIKSGYKSEAFNLARNIHTLAQGRIDEIKRLVADQPKVHLQTILTEGHLDAKAGFLNEHLAWLLLPERAKELTAEILEDMLEDIENNTDLMIAIDADIRKRIEDEYRLSRSVMPPLYFIDLSNDIADYHDAFDFSVYFYPKEKDQIIGFTGGVKSGKTESLRYFQYAYPDDTTFYVFLDAQDSDLDNTSLLFNLQHACTEIILDICIKYPYAWSALAPALQDKVALAIKRHPSLLDSDPINKIKLRNRHRPDTVMNANRASLIKKLQELYATDREVADDLGFFRVIGDVISALKYTSICLSIDNLHPRANPAMVLRTLNGYLDQDISLRFVCRMPPQFHSPLLLELKWDFERLSMVFEAMLGTLNRFNSYLEVRESFIQQATVPGDFKLWLAVFDTLYPTQEIDITPIIWNTVFAAMCQARDEVAQGTYGWSESICARAIELLREPRA